MQGEENRGASNEAMEEEHVEGDGAILYTP